MDNPMESSKKIIENKLRAVLSFSFVVTVDLSGAQAVNGWHILGLESRARKVASCMSNINSVKEVRTQVLEKRGAPYFGTP